MKLPIQINGKTVEIELTSDQIAQVKKETGKITDRIKTEKDVYKALGYDKNDWEDMHIFDRIASVAQVLNEGWKPDWNNSSEGKYAPYFKWNGSAFVYNCYHCWVSLRLWVPGFALKIANWPYTQQSSLLICIMKC